MADTKRTCPACLHKHEVHDGFLVRHGWRAFDVQRGNFGGWHTAPCIGWRDLPFERPEGRDRTAEVYLPEARESLAKAEQAFAALSPDSDPRRRAHMKVFITETKVLITAYEQALAEWVEGKPVVHAPKLKHASGVACGSKRAGDFTPYEEHVTCPECLEALGAERAARSAEPQFDALMERLAAKASTEGKLLDAYNAVVGGRSRVKVDPELRETIKRGGRGAREDQALRHILQYWGRAIVRRNRETPVKTVVARHPDGFEVATKRSRDDLGFAMITGMTREEEAPYKERANALARKPQADRTKEEEAYLQLWFLRDVDFKARFFATREEAEKAAKKTKLPNPIVVEVER